MITVTIRIPVFSEDLKSDHWKSGNILIPDLGGRISNGWALAMAWL